MQEFWFKKNKTIYGIFSVALLLVVLLSSIFVGHAAELDDEARELGSELQGLSDRFTATQEKLETISSETRAQNSAPEATVSFFRPQNYSIWLFWLLLIGFIALLITMRKYFNTTRQKKISVLPKPPDQIRQNPALVQPVKLVKIKVRKITREGRKMSHNKSSITKKNSTGFTLLELLVVVAIIGFLSSISIVALSASSQSNRDKQRIVDQLTIIKSVELYTNDFGVPPTQYCIDEDNNGDCDANVSQSPSATGNKYASIDFSPFDIARSVFSIPRAQGTQSGGGGQKRDSNGGGGGPTPPADVSNLSVSNITQNSVLLSWSAPGDDGNTGQAQLYDVRYSTFALNSSNWDSATQAFGEPSPRTAGITQSMPISVLTSGTTYYFGLKTRDETVWSGLSNVPMATTDFGPCGNLICEPGIGENVATCPADCYSGGGPEVCLDNGQCDAGETPGNCDVDCTDLSMCLVEGNWDLCCLFGGDEFCQSPGGSTGGYYGVCNASQCEQKFLLQGPAFTCTTDAECTPSLPGTDDKFVPDSAGNWLSGLEQYIAIIPTDPGHHADPLYDWYYASSHPDIVGRHKFCIWVSLENEEDNFNPYNDITESPTVPLDPLWTVLCTT